MIMQEIKYSENKFWIIGEDEYGPYEEEIKNWRPFAANGFKWGASYRMKGQRKDRHMGVTTLTIDAMLEIVKSKLQDVNCQYVIVHTPDVRLTFFKD